jgi:SAM-dependent methyltransferase
VKHPRRFHNVLSSWLTLALAVFAAVAQGQAQSADEYRPSAGQPGKDVVWVPTSMTLVQKMLDLAAVKQDDVVMDLGSGDGRTVIAAARRGARAIGVEFNADMIALSRRAARTEHLAGLTAFLNADLFDVDLSQATVITMFLLPELNLRLRPTLLALKPGTRIVSNSFAMRDWEPDETATVQDDECSQWCTALLWIVPARVEGVWRLEDPRSHAIAWTLTLEQRYQIIYGSLIADAGLGPVKSGSLRGDEIAFTANGATYRGRVTGNTIDGTVTYADGATGNWRSRRIE